MSDCVGGDVSKHHLDWIVGSEGTVSRESNTPAGVRRLIAKLRRGSVTCVVVESTGGYERPLVEACAGRGLPVCVVNPWRVRRFGEGLGKLAKTDPEDARLLALYGERARPAPQRESSPRQREMAEFVRRRRQLIAMITAEKSRLETMSKPMCRDIQSLVGILERRVAKLDAKIDTAIRADAKQSATFERLQGVPCVGPGVARALIVDLPELGTLSRKQIASLVGLAPFARDSGMKSGYRRTRAGRAAPRTMLFLAAMNGARFNPELKAMYERLVNAGKPKKVALIAIARKLLTMLNAMVRDGSDWKGAAV
jgi:transposase